MFIGLIVLCCILCIIITGLVIKLILMRKSAREITEAFADRIENETNTLVDISSRDSCMRQLADRLNDDLILFHKERLKFIRGDCALKEAISNISHDIRTPLTAICGYLDLLKRENLPVDAVRYLHAIQNRTDALKNLTEELFQYSVIASVNEGDKDTGNSRASV